MQRAGSKRENINRLLPLHSLSAIALAEVDAFSILPSPSPPNLTVKRAKLNGFANVFGGDAR